MKNTSLFGFRIFGFLILLSFVLFNLSFVIPAPAGAVPQYINYQGVLRAKTSGALQTGTFTMRFKVYDAETSGTAVFDSGNTSVAVDSGIYNVRLGAVNSSTIFEGSDRWLEVAVVDPTTGTTDTMTPRLRINSVAYALKADLATTAESATNALALGGYAVGLTAGTIPTIDATGKLPSTIVPASGTATTAATADYATLAGTATTAATATNSTKLGGYFTATSGNSIVPTTDATTGKLSTAVIPTTITVSTAELATNATNATSATSATNATTVNSINAATTATASYLFPLDSAANFTLSNSAATPVISGRNTGSGVGVSAESATGNALYINGKLGANAAANKCVGTGTLTVAGDPTVVINNTSITANSIILLTVGHSATPAAANSNAGIRVSAKTAGTSFTVATMDGNAPSADIPFSYLIIN